MAPFARRITLSVITLMHLAGAALAQMADRPPPAPKDTVSSSTGSASPGPSGPDGAPTINVAPAVSGTTGSQALPLWDHNGSMMRLVSNGPQRQFIYEQPRQGMREVGVSSGTLFFSGRRDGNTYSGTARVFSRNCGASTFSVSGSVSADQRSVTLYGNAPLVSSSCRITGYRPETLVFNYLGD